MPLSQDQVSFVKHQIESLPHHDLRFLGNVLIIAPHDARGHRKPEPQDVIDRLISPDSYLEFDPTGPADSKWTAVFGLRTTIKLDWTPLSQHYFENAPTSHRGAVSNTLGSTDAFIFVYEDTDRESFEEIFQVNSKIQGHLLNPQPLEAPAKTETPQSWHKRAASGIGRRLSLKRRGSTRNKVRERSASQPLSTMPIHEDAPISQQVSAPVQPPKPADVGQIPKFVVANCRTKGESVVNHDEGRELAASIGAHFFTISTDRLKWGDRDVLHHVCEHLMFQRMSGKSSSKEWPDRNC